MVDSLYYSSRKISERSEYSFQDYRINYQKLCYLMRQITKDLNWPIVYNQISFQNAILIIDPRYCKCLQGISLLSVT